MQILRSRCDGFGYRGDVARTKGGWVDARDKDRHRPARRGGRLAKDEVAQRIARFLEVAMERFGEDGFDSTSLDHLVACTGVSKTTIFRHFGSKRGIFLALMEQNVSAMQLEIWAVELDPADPIGSIARFVERYVDAAICDPMAHALLRIAAADRKRFPDLSRTIMEYARETLGPLRTYLRRLMDDGVLCEADTDELAFDLQALAGHGFRSMVEDQAYLQRPGRADEIARRFVKGWS
jgi:AcrR family transcriptional regulator